MGFHRKFLAIFLALVSSGANAAEEADKAVRDRLAALLNAPEYKGSVVVNYCIADFDMDGKVDYAFGTVINSQMSGIYVVQLGDRLIELAPHNTGSDLQCLDARKAGELNNTIEASEGIHGGIESSGPGDIVCGFVNETEAVCWKYDKSTNSFVVVGGWIT